MTNLLQLVNVRDRSSHTYYATGRDSSGTAWTETNAPEFGAECSICRGDIGCYDGGWTSDGGTWAHDECVTRDYRPDRLYEQTGTSRADPLPSSANGGYPFFYVNASADILCPTCANQSDYNGDPFTCVTDADINWEDPDLTCSDCGQPIPSAYSD